MFGLTAVILAGGAGRRYAAHAPGKAAKQFLDPRQRGQSLLQQAIGRAHALDHLARIVVVTHLANAVRSKQHIDAARPAVPVFLIIEPLRRNTAAAVAAATFAALERCWDVPMAILPADHDIPDEEAFGDDMLSLVHALPDQGIGLLGIPPDHPSPEYGYVLPGPALKTGLQQVARFQEKPSAETAASYIAQGGLWNSGISVCRPAVMDAALQKHAPLLHAACRQAFTFRIARKRAIAFPAHSYRAIPEQSIDSAVLEKAKHLYLWPASFAWADVGAPVPSPAKQPAPVSV